MNQKQRTRRINALARRTRDVADYTKSLSTFAPESDQAKRIAAKLKVAQFEVARLQSVLGVQS